MEKGGKLIIFGLVLGASVIAAAAVVSQAFLDVKQLDNTIMVSGSARQSVTADSAIWNSTFSRNAYASDLKAGYDQMKADEKAIASFLDSNGFSGQYEISPVFMNEVYDYNKGADAPKQYSLVQNVELKSDKVEKVKELAKNSGQLAERGVLFSPAPVAYYYSGLAEARVSLLPAAIVDAKNRAAAIAQTTGQEVGNIKSVTMGVVQVMPVGAIDISDYGTYDTSGIEKDVMVTVKATFGLE